MSFCQFVLRDGDQWAFDGLQTAAQLLPAHVFGKPAAACLLPDH